MNVDIIDIALEHISDYERFESLASEIMRNEGFPDIKALGGHKDYGQDAAVERLYQDSMERYVFQYSVDKKTYGKILNTIGKLKKNGIKFNLLIYVTSIKITSQEQADIKKKIRCEHNVDIDIYERRTLANRLSDYKNGIFNRYFASIDKQIEDLRAAKPLLSADAEQQFEIACLKTTLAISLNPESARTRKSIFDNLIFAIIYLYKDGITLDKIKAELFEKFSEKVFSLAQIQASVIRIQSKGYIEERANSFFATQNMVRTVELSVDTINIKTEYLINCIVENAIDIFQKSVADSIKRIMSRNVRKVISEVLNNLGVEFACNMLGERKNSTIDVQSIQSLLEICQADLDTNLATILFATLASTMNSPTEEQAESLHYWVAGHLGKIVMNLDPTLGEFQLTRISNKIFIVDTDYVLNSMVKESPNSDAYRQTIIDLLNAGAKVVVPTIVAEECAVHACYSPRTYSYFSNELLKLPDYYVDTDVNNIFVRGFYYGITNKKLNNNMTFYKYLENYYDKIDSNAFIQDVIHTNIDGRIDFLPLSQISDLENIDIDQKDAVYNEMLKLASGSISGRTRVTDHNKIIAQNDSDIFFAVNNANINAHESSSTSKKYYILTSSSRYNAVSSRLGYNNIPTSNLSAINSLLFLIGKANAERAASVKSMFQPLLIYSVSQASQDVKKLLQLGIDVSDKSLPRLRRDLDNVFHDRLTAMNFEDENSEDFVRMANATVAESIKLDYVSSVHKSEIDERDNQIIILREQLAKSNEKLSEKDKIIIDFETGVKEYTQKRQRYFKRILRGEKSTS